MGTFGGSQTRTPPRSHQATQSKWLALYFILEIIVRIVLIFSNCCCQVIYSRRDRRKKCPFVGSVSCSVAHHDLSPTFAAEEVKMALPVNLTRKHHILFTLGHVAVAAALSTKPSDAQTPVESACGYAWLPLKNSTTDGRLSLDEDEVEFNLPIATELPENYLSCKPLGLGKGVSYANSMQSMHFVPFFPILEILP